MYPFILCALLSLRCSIAIPIEFFVSLTGDEDQQDQHNSPTSSLLVKCSDGELPPFCASRFCSHHGLTQNIEGLSCQQLIADEIVQRGRDEGESKGYVGGEEIGSSEVVMLRIDGTSRRDDQLLIGTVQRFCQNFRIDGDAQMQILLNSVHEHITKLNDVNGVNDDRRAYLPVIVDDYVSVDVSLDNMEGSYRFHARTNPVTVAQNLCISAKLAPADCNIDSFVAVITTKVNEFYNNNNNYAYLLPPLADYTLSGLEFANNDNESLLFVLNRQESIGRNVASFCAMHHCPDRINYSSALVEYFRGVNPGYEWVNPPVLVDKMTNEPIEVNEKTR